VWRRRFFGMLYITSFCVLFMTVPVLLVFHLSYWWWGLFWGLFSCTVLVGVGIVEAGDSEND
jgi:hypothetical protein